LQDIRKFFSGTAATQNKSKETSSKSLTVDCSTKTAAKVADTKSTQPKTKTVCKTVPVKPPSVASTGGDDVCVIDSESESEDFSCKRSKKNFNNNDIKPSKRSKSSKSAETKESSSAISVSDKQHHSEADKQHLSASNKRSSGGTGKRSRSMRVKDEAATASTKTTTPSKSDYVCQELCYFCVQILH